MFKIRWSRVGIPLCLFNRHAPVREEARWNGRTYTGTCRHCGTSITRMTRGRWHSGAKPGRKSG